MKILFSSIKEFCLELVDPFLEMAPQFIALHGPAFILRIVFTFLSTFFSIYEKSIREYANLGHQAIFLSCFLLRESQRPRMYFKSQAITCCLIQVDSSSEIQLSQNFVLTLLPVSCMCKTISIIIFQGHGCLSRHLTYT